jgi:hypothetical protein
MKGALGIECLPLHWSSVKGTWGGGALAGGPKGYIGKALGMGISPTEAQFGQPGEGSSTGDFGVGRKGL